MASPFNDFVPYKNGIADEVGVFDDPDYSGGNDRPTTPRDILTCILMLAVFLGLMVYGGLFN